MSYGSTRRMMAILADCYRVQHGLRTISLFVPNMYGPYESTDPTKAHALSALVSKVVKAKSMEAPAISVWGTGIAVREWLYAPDFARIIRETIARNRELPFEAPINVGQRDGLSVRDLLSLIVEESGYGGAISWDTTKPDGAPKKVMDDVRFRTHFPTFAFTSLREGIRATIAWYQAQLPY
jgi:GDP-L-fucose synthase